MTEPISLPNPFKIVADAIGCKQETLTIESAMYRDHGWDSFGHVSVITGLEAAYGKPIANDDIEKYTTMRAIQEFYDMIVNENDS